MSTGSTALSRKEREREQHRKDIIDAAMRLFAKQGYHSVSMQEIAAEAEFATGTLYKFFPGKRELFREIMVGVIADITSELRPVWSSEGDPMAIITKFLQARRVAFNKRHEYILLYNMVGNGFGSSGDEVVDALIAERRKEVENNLITLFTKGIEQGLFKPVNVEVLARLFEDFCQTIIRSEAVRGELDEETMASIKDLFLNGILA
ncbi:TetR/AcrR family transcriptional regulator [Halodesulfovibrio sp.]|uniref:TetR/AcrR family transcriptional regulator n=1 Tax=Halodesulfovibrio sp. TaxID=1912772 RepID=UPI0025EBB481|nr:TetR/AcrR family transcriptional regulator [Halodesulfovibrio sp.]MCT4534077.1 TetR/AcrR family transcriptional regulator [Halodesulfovibrio sp.]MCT4627574.1 TetR/AcrR family transcriptional regulator [Halodesulfovibrio sp.]